MLSGGSQGTSCDPHGGTLPRRDYQTSFCPINPPLNYPNTARDPQTGRPPAPHVSPLLPFPTLPTALAHSPPE